MVACCPPGGNDSVGLVVKDGGLGMESKSGGSIATDADDMLVQGDAATAMLFVFGVVDIVLLVWIGVVVFGGGMGEVDRAGVVMFDIGVCCCCCCRDCCGVIGL